MALTENEHEEGMACARALYDSLRETVDEEQFELMRHLVWSFADHLGESREAWRGALGTCGFIGTILGSAELDDDYHGAVAMSHAALVILVQHPGAQAHLARHEEGN